MSYVDTYDIGISAMQQKMTYVLTIYTFIRLTVRDEVLGKRFDVDAHYGAQCWDGYAYYMQKIGYAFAICTSAGYVKDIWDNRKTNGMLNSCDIITIMQ